MAELLLIAVAAATIDNFVLARLLGLSPVFAAGKPADPAEAAIHALKLGLATTVALAISVGLGQQLNHWILIPWHLPYLRILGLLLVTGVVITLVDSLLRRAAERGAAGVVRLPVITVQSLVLGVTLLVTGVSNRPDSMAADTLPAAIALGLGAGLGYTVVICVFASLRTRLERSVVPVALRGPAIAMLTIGIMALAFTGFSGVGLSAGPGG